MYHPGVTRLRLRQAATLVLAAAAVGAAGCEREKKPDARAELEKQRATIMQRLDRIAGEQAASDGALRVVVTAVGDRPADVAAVLGEGRRDQPAPVPGEVATGCTAEDAAALAKRLRDAGATVSVEPVTPPQPASEPSPSPGSGAPPVPPPGL